ncbi:hypothetical protein L3X38_033694 [Prunus dulcis]|uniref:Uncharacterized protein n=1 Tax=Prunus dulcis TaxID=3755 RepID=A0AAD4YX18_PRUDU|nr:hypothetical protein L3X38_033694 [Prunus dulcis]
MDQWVHKPTSPTRPLTLWSSPARLLTPCFGPARPRGILPHKYYPSKYLKYGYVKCYGSHENMLGGLPESIARLVIKTYQDSALYDSDLHRKLYIFA